MKSTKRLVRKMLEEELLELSHLAEIMYEYMQHDRRDVIELSTMLNYNPELLKAFYLYSYDKEKAEILIKMIKERRLKNEQRKRIEKEDTRTKE